MSPTFATRLLDWHDRNGRTDLPWQTDPTLYRVWVSEIMLQQTQVATVIGYFERFLARFPEIGALADASVDEVLHLWSGLGYYARARNLHRAAGRIRDEHGGKMPERLEALVALPGIGRSTAGAILALSRGQRHPILDGNVKRVLCRHHGIDEWPGRAPVERRLWALADAHTPGARVAQYTQAIMDLGATVCVPARPLCLACPVQGSCVAARDGLAERLPVRRDRRAVPQQRTRFVVARRADGSVWLEQRPPSGIWGGLWSFPECAPDADVAAWCVQRLGTRPDRLETLGTIRHVFTHYRLDIEPVVAHLGDAGGPVAEVAERSGLWYERSAGHELGLAAPVAELLRALEELD